MGTQHKIMSGARAILKINGATVGLFTAINYSVTYDLVPSHILGRYSPAELTYTGQEAVSVNASGLRIVDQGPYASMNFPKLQQLLNHEDITLTIVDRKTGKEIMNVIGVRPVAYSSNSAARGLMDVNIQFLGLRAEDESGPQGESAGATSLP